MAALTRLAVAVGRTVDCPLETDVLWNHTEAAVSITAAAEADFVRVGVHTGAAVTDQDVFQDRAHETLRLREQLGVATKILVGRRQPREPVVSSGRSATDWPIPSNGGW